MSTSWAVARYDLHPRPEPRLAWRARLVEERRFLLDPRSVLSAELEALPTLAGDPAATALRAAVNAALADVDDALVRMDDGRYGRCVECSQAIPAERLDVLPMAARCAPCHRVG